MPRAGSKRSTTSPAWGATARRRSECGCAFPGPCDTPRQVKNGFVMSAEASSIEEGRVRRLPGIHSIRRRGKHGISPLEPAAGALRATLVCAHAARPPMSDERDPSSGRAEDEPLRLVYGARTEFAGNVSRDLRAPLTLLLGPLQDLLDGPAAALAPGMRAVLERARRDAVRLLQLVDLLPAALTRRGTAASPDTTDLGSFTAELAGYFRPLCEAAGLQLEVDSPPLSPQADVDREAWERIVVNLVANAFKSTLEGTIAVRLRLEEGTAELTVSDTSPGMPPAELRYVFERLDRAAPASAESSAGGFGLPFVRDVVRQQMGTIDVRSTVGGGT